MKLLIDIQGCQTNSQYRGIGRYSFQIVKAILENKEDHTIILFANGNFKDSLYKLRSEFLKYIPDENFIVFNAEFPVAEINNENSVRCRLAEIYREKLISTIKPDAVLITSLFEGFEDNAVTSIGRTGSKPFTAVILYDLIPYLYPDPNWPPEYHSYYDKKIQSFKHAIIFFGGHFLKLPIFAFPRNLFFDRARRESPTYRERIGDFHNGGRGTCPFFSFFGPSEDVPPPSIP